MSYLNVRAGARRLRGALDDQQFHQTLTIGSLAAFGAGLGQAFPLALPDLQGHITALQSILLGGTALVFNVIALLWLAPLGDRVNTKFLLPGLAAGMTLLTVAVAVAPLNGWLLIVLAAALGALSFGEGIGRSVLDRRERLPESESQRRAVQIQAALLMGLGVITSVFAPLYGWLGRAGAFVMLALVAAAIAVALWRKTPNDPVIDRRRARHPNIRRALANPPVQSAAIQALLHGTAFGALIVPMALIVAEHGLKSWLWIFGLRQFVTLAGILFWMRVIDRRWAPVVANGLLWTPFVFMLLAAGSKSLVLVVVPFVVIDLVVNLCWATDISRSGEDATDKSIVIAGWVFGIGGIGGYLGLGAYKLLGDIGPATLSLTAALAALALVPAFLRNTSGKLEETIPVPIDVKLRFGTHPTTGEPVLVAADRMFPAAGRRAVVRAADGTMLHHAQDKAGPTGPGVILRRLLPLREHAGPQLGRGRRATRLYAPGHRVDTGSARDIAYHISPRGPVVVSHLAVELDRHGHVPVDCKLEIWRSPSTTRQWSARLESAVKALRALIGLRSRLDGSVATSTNARLAQAGACSVALVLTAAAGLASAWVPAALGLALLALTATWATATEVAVRRRVAPTDVHGAAARAQLRLWTASVVLSAAAAMSNLLVVLIATPLARLAGLLGLALAALAIGLASGDLGRRWALHRQADRLADAAWSEAMAYEPDVDRPEVTASADGLEVTVAYDTPPNATREEIERALRAGLGVPVTVRIAGTS